MTRIVDGLVALGLAERGADPADGRAVRISPTPRGTALMHQARRRRVEAIAAVVHGLSEEERRLLADAAPLLGRVARGVRDAG